MELRFYIDPETGESHIHQHGVSEEEVQQVLESPADELGGRNDSRIALGQTESGRTLQVVYVPDPGRRSAFVITAYDLRGKALIAYRRRRRQRR